MKIHNITDLQRYVSELLANHDPDEYEMTAEELVETVSERYRDFLEEAGFVYGQHLPKLSDDDWAVITDL